MIFQRIILIVSFFIFSGNFCFGQKLVDLSGKGTVRQESNMTLDQVREKARQVAQINAIEKEFGTTVQQQTEMTINDGRDAFYIIGSTKVRGEWIITSKEDFKIRSEVNKTGSGNMADVYIDCEVFGKGRKAPPAIGYEFRTLKCPRISCESSTYNYNEPFYLFFKSPIDGFLSVFMEEEDSVRRLLPYSGMTGSLNNCLPIKADKENLFFDSKQTDYQPGLVDDVCMTTVNKEKPERNTLWVIFSSDSYYKPGLSKGMKKGDLILPMALSKNEFHQWRAQNSASKSGFQSQMAIITVLPKQ